MSESLLGAVVNGFVEESVKETFINRIHKETGIAKEELSESYEGGLRAASQCDQAQNPDVWAKSRVYRYVNDRQRQSET